MLPEAAAAMTAADAPRYAVLVRIACMSSTLRLWSGLGDLDIEADDVDLTGGRFQGIGLIGELPAIRQLIGGTAERLDFNLTAPSGAVFDLGDADVAEVRSAPVSMAIVFFDADWQIAGAPVWLWDGTADVPSVNRSSSGLEVTRSVTLSVGSAFTDRTRAQLTYFTDADQRRRSPTDRFCERVAGYTGVSTVKWPN